MSEIRFFSRKPPHTHFEFSNFARFEISIDGRKWPTTEHYYQAMKFNDIALQEQVRGAPYAGAAAKLGRSLMPIREDWEYAKVRVMEKALYHKFTQHPELAQLLLSTGTSVLIEDSPWDYFWGCGKDNTGRNELGKALMRLRDELNE